MLHCTIGAGRPYRTRNKGISDVLYNSYEMQRAWLSSASAWASVASQWLTNPANPVAYLGMGPIVRSALDVFAHASARYGKPEFGIASVEVDGEAKAVTETIVQQGDFCDLIRFVREDLPEDAPKLLIVAPMSGHYATLLRGTVERMIESAEVFITDWADAKMVPAEKGPFDLDDYIDQIIAYSEFLGAGHHMLAVCQPSVPAFAATAIMASRKVDYAPATLTMMGGPIDTRQSPTSVNDLAMQRPISWFRNQVIATVPLQYPGAGRRVYPGFLQLAGFMSMNLGSHLMSHYEMFKHLTVGDTESADRTKEFYDEYRSVCDMTAEFYLQTVEEVFQKHSLPKNEFMHRGELVDLGAITDTAILAIEGERDDISGVGQTRAALDLTPNLPLKKKKYHLAPGAGHYGIFNGSKWKGQIAPVLEEWMAANAR